MFFWVQVWYINSLIWTKNHTAPLKHSYIGLSSNLRGARPYRTLFGGDERITLFKGQSYLCIHLDHFWLQTNVQFHLESKTQEKRVWPKNYVPVDTYPLQFNVQQAQIIGISCPSTAGPKGAESYMLHYQVVATFMQGLWNKGCIHNQM